MMISALGDGPPMKVMIYNTLPQDEQIEQMVTSLISWNNERNVFKNYEGKLVTLVTMQVGFRFGMHMDVTLYTMEKYLKECVLYVSGNKARYGNEVKIPPKICRGVRESVRLLDSARTISKEDRDKTYVGW